ncbi:hypothetical protein [Haloarcula sp. Atlit-7R]|uniref:hypothetical protein n=1 Tax=Haloarcula sp. Atlit-7R TaxID=2282125 RepID=UPI000EF14191|nr:hypothetical protein [Haloarcula sp. Atlit-7R]RLM87897.1 hypothetical protein D3D01_22270 [Haloarcula sp. Atlit-7R]
MTTEDTTRRSGQESTAPTITVDVELTEPLAEMIQRTSDDDVTLSEWVTEAAERRLTLFSGAEFPAPVDVPDEAAEFAELRAEHARLKGKDPEDIHLMDYVTEHVDLQFDYPEDDE